MNWLVLARAWIGGVGFATSVLLPGISASVAAPQRFASFRAFESRFVWIARALVVIVGASGFYMLVGLHLGAAMVLPRSICHPGQAAQPRDPGSTPPPRAGPTREPRSPFECDFIAASEPCLF
jgi:hypothetical protein